MTEQDKKKFYITTSIAYVNSDPHIGFALELVQADVLARCHKLLGEEVFFLTGTDEHGSKVPKAAVAAGKPLPEFVNAISDKFRNLTQVLNISNSHFIRTSEQGHKKAAQKFWEKVLENGDIYKFKYEGLYCEGCENYYNEDDLENGLCPTHKAKLEFFSEENYFFRFSKYQKPLLEHFEKHPDFVLPKSRYNEILQLIRSGLKDISISRSAKVLPWGVPVPGDKTQTMYIWFDALINYVSGIGFLEEDETYRKFWPADVHLIGKDILRFHAALWPAMLLSAGLPLPRQILTHGWITLDGEKISKSRGITVDPFALVKKYGVDALRYFLLREIPSDNDGDFSLKKFETRYTADLVNNLGNLVSRLTNLIERDCHGEVPELVETPKKAKRLVENIEKFRFHEALSQIWENISWANQYIGKVKLWELPKKDPALFEQTISSLVALLKQVTIEIAPFLPATAEKLDKIFRAEKIKKAAPLFPRIN